MLAVDTNKIVASIFRNNYNLSKSVQRLSTNKKLSTDNPSKTVIAVGYKKYLRATKVSNDGISQSKEMISTASTAAETVLDKLQDMRELAVTASDSNMTDAERTLISSSEWTVLRAATNKIATNTKYNGTILATGVWWPAGTKSFNIGPNGNNYLSVKMPSSAKFDLQQTNLGTDSGSISITTQSNAQAAVTAIDSAIDTVTGFQAVLDTTNNALDDFYNINDVVATNYEASISTLEDIDVAEEMVNYTAQSVLQQSSISMLAQGNLANQNMLALFA